jgi:hypothetical protein
VTGWKTEFEGVQAIFAREMKYGIETYVFRAKAGMPAWIYLVLVRILPTGQFAGSFRSAKDRRVRQSQAA